MTTASKITLARVVFIPLFMLLMYLSDFGTNLVLRYTSLAVFIIASITDYVDGHIARKYNQVSDFGKFLDPLADKLLTIAAMVIFCEWGIFPAWALMIVLTREFAVTGLRLVAVGKGKVIAAGWSGKVKTASTMVGLCVMIVFPQVEITNWIVVGVTVVTTVYSGIEYFIQNWNCLWDDEA
ncbi:MAG: CDP-diacylglycerol--glycerol-3-phosphate 3-phosphatidyltransferase [Ruminococcaceae bacterium]|nr:CDP-diacylglycerol--glycerol-3-phosphate 3-phosphatidyltransferase [Oscillospiraceae bacterium]